MKIHQFTKICICDINASLLMKTRQCKNSLWWGKFIIMMKINCCDKILLCNLTSSICWIFLHVEVQNSDKNLSLWGKQIIFMKIHHYDENSSLWWKFAHVTKIPCFDENSIFWWKINNLIRFIILMKINHCIENW